MLDFYASEIMGITQKLYVTQSWALVNHPNTGEVFLISSGLQHFVETNSSTEPRYSIAFNTFIKGTIGELRDVSELTL